MGPKPRKIPESFEVEYNSGKTTRELAVLFSSGTAKINEWRKFLGLSRPKKRKYATCHPNEFVDSHGLCSTCYQQTYYAGRGGAMQRLRRYNLTEAQYQSMVEAQGGKCAICSKVPNGVGLNGKKLHIDHCHITNKVRGLLCRECNHAIGALGDSADGVRRALTYLGNF
jgi:hypothetical protein